MKLTVPEDVKYIDLTSENNLITKSKTNLQRNRASSIIVADKVLTTFVNKNDIDSVSKSNDRRRNEISSKIIELNNGEKGIWGGEFKINEKINTVNSWYHILQIKYNDNLKTFKDPNNKTLDRSVPPFTISFFNDYLCVRPNLNRGYIPIALIKDVINKWISFRIEVENIKNGTIKWFINNYNTVFEQIDENIDDITLEMKNDIKNKQPAKLYKCGTYKCKDLGTINMKEGGLYFKCGQYMSSDYEINQNYSTSYRNIWAKKL